MSATIHSDFHNTVSAKQAIEILKTSAEALISNPVLAHELPALLFRGPAGVGKSTIVKDVAKELGIGFIDIRLAQMDRCDLAGIPSVVNGQTVWNIPSIWPQDPDSAGIIFFDELTSASADVQVAAYSMILDRKIPNTGYELPAKWLIVAAGNRAIDRAVVRSMSSALANRFAHFELEANAEDWGIYAVSHDFHPSVTGFIRFMPQNLHVLTNQNLEAGFPTPRSWEKVSNMLKLFGTDELVLEKIVYSLVGPSAGLEFLAFHKTQSKFTNVLEILTNPKAKFTIPSKIDERYAFCSACSYLLWQGETDAENAKRVDGFYRIVMELDAAFAAWLVHAASAGSSKVNRLKAILLLKKAKGYKAFNEKFGTAFNKKYTLD